MPRGSVRLSSLIAATLLLSAPAVAAGPAALDLPGGRLGDALVALGQQAGISVGVSDPGLAARPVRGLRGRYTVEQALARLLRGSGARFTAIDTGTYRIAPGPPPPRRARRAARPAAPPARPPAEVEMAEILVTAKRPVPLADYPGAAATLDPAMPALALNGRGMAALSAALPAVHSTHLGSGRDKLFVRGIADSSFNGPTQATVGQYLGETRLTYNAPDPDLRLYDVERVELLAGPHGTLYGAGSLGGVLRILPRAPDPSRLAGEVGIGASLTQAGDPGGELSAMLNLPIAPGTAALRLVGYGIGEGGYIDDPRRGLADVNRSRIAGGRAALRIETADGWTVDLGAAGQHIDGRDGQFADRDGPPLTRESAVAEPYRSDYLLADLAVRRAWGGTRLVVATGLVRQFLSERYDASRPHQAPAVFDQTNRVEMLSAETRLSHDAASGSGWLVGSAFLSSRSRQRRALGPPEAPIPSTGVGNGVEEATLYGEGTVMLRPRLAATLGGRLTHARLSGSVLDAPERLTMELRSVTARRAETAFLPSLAFAWRPADDLTVFARYQEGFRPGGLAVSNQWINRFESDRLAALEAGFRLGRRGLGGFDLAASAAYARWTDVQADLVNMAGFPTTANIGDGRVYTLDLQAGWRPLPGLDLELGAILNDSEVTDPRPGIIIVRSSPLPNVAQVNGRAGITYRAELAGGERLVLWGQGRYAGTSRLGIGPVLGETQGDWLDVSLGARLERGGHGFTLGLANLLDARGNRFAMGSPFMLTQRRQITPLRPRTLGIGWDVRF